MIKLPDVADYVTDPSQEPQDPRREVEGLRFSTQEVLARVSNGGSPLFLPHAHFSPCANVIPLSKIALMKRSVLNNG